MDNLDNNVLRCILRVISYVRKSLILSKITFEYVQKKFKTELRFPNYQNC